LEIPLYINEFMADNDNIIADQDSEYDDWVEIYNGADTAISLNGYYLTDDGAELMQWAFPDTSIAAGGFLLIWADDDIEQAGLHASFKLGASGEEIVFSTPSQTIVDEITFGEQTTDISYGRCPDGNETWMSCINPSPESANDCYICGDVNADDVINLSDILDLISCVYVEPVGEPAPQPAGSGDVNNDGSMNLTDILNLIAYVYVEPIGDPVLTCP
jgi:lamin tail-like protein/dockerin type I repeat protein